MVGGKGHSNQVQDMAVNDQNLVTCAMDDTVMFSNLASIDKSGYGLLLVNMKL